MVNLFQYNTVIEELETSNEELQASNEELMASNEELQGTNEELQSVNEELYTVNTELISKNKELVDLSNDINNLLINTDIGTLFLDKDLKIRKFTPALKKHFNLEDSDIGRPISNFTNQFPSRNDNEFGEQLKTVMATRKIVELEIMDKAGHVYLKKIIPYVLANYKVDGVIITYIDITNITKIESELRDSEFTHKKLASELQLIIDHFPGLIFYKDDKNNYLKVNKFMADSYKLEKSEIEGKNLKDLHTPKKAAELWKEDLEVIATGKSKLHIIEQRKMSDENRWYNTNKILIKNAYDNSTNLLGISTDITELIKTEETLKKSLAKLESSNHELSQFAYIASHDLQEPLNNIISFIDLYLEKYGDSHNEEAKTYFNFVNEAVNRMKNLIKDILYYSRIDKETQLTTFSPNELINDVLKDFKTLIDENQAVISTLDLPKQVTGYKTGIRLLFQNLISNAVKFNTNKTPRVDISCIEKHDYFQFSIKDNGIGIDKDHHEKIFEIFQRLHSNASYKGTGIGLAHCKKVVEIHRGKIWIESELNSGSTFIFTIFKKLAS